MVAHFTDRETGSVVPYMSMATCPGPADPALRPCWGLACHPEEVLWGGTSWPVCRQCALARPRACQWTLRVTSTGKWSLMARAWKEMQLSLRGPAGQGLPSLRLHLKELRCPPPVPTGPQDGAHWVSTNHCIWGSKQVRPGLCTPAAVCRWGEDTDLGPPPQERQRTF